MMNWLRQHKKFIGTLLLVAITSFGFGVYQKLYLPKIKHWTLNQIISLTRKHSPIIVEAESVNFDLFPLGATLNKVSITPKAELANVIVPTEIQSVSAHISLWSFLIGKLELSDLSLDNFDLKIFIPKKENNSSAQQGTDFSFLNQVPLQKVTIKNARVWIQDRNTQLSAQAPELELEITKRRLALLIYLDTKGFKLKRTGDKAIFDSDASFRLRVDRDQIILNRLRVKKEDSFVLASGTLDWDSRSLKFDRVSGRTRSLIQMRDVEYISKEFFPTYNIPSLQGRLFLEVSTDHDIGKQLEGKVRMRSRNLIVDDFHIGDIKAEGDLNESQSYFKQINIRHPGGQAQLEELQLQLKSPYKVNGNLKGSDINLNSLLTHLKVKDIPLYTKMAPDMKCSGQLESPIQMTCTGNIHAKSFLIRSKSDDKTENDIVEFKNLNAKANINVLKDKVSYEAELSLPNSITNSKGSIDYDGKFDIDATAPKLDFSDIGKIASLELSGVTRANGTFSNRKGPFSTKLNLYADDVRLDGWLLGQLDTELIYKEGILSFNKAVGKIEDTSYTGQVSLNFRKDLISIDTQMSRINLSELNAIIPEKHAAYKFETAGMGSGSFKMYGPMNFLESDWSAHFTTGRGIFAGESFDETLINVQSKAGQLTSQNCLVRKGNGRLNCELKGNLTQKPILDIVGTRLNLEQSENIQANIENLSGYLDFQFGINNFISAPELSGFGTLTNIQLGDLPLPSVDFKLLTSPDENSASFKMGSDIVNIDYMAKKPDLSKYTLSGKFNNWDFSQLFSAFSDSLRVNTYEANLRGDFKFTGSTQSLNLLSGNFDIENLSLKSNNIKIENSQPMSIVLDKGRIEPKNFLIEGSDNFIRLKNSDARTPVALKAEGKLEMTLLSVLTPFFDDLKGIMTFSLDARGEMDSINISGNTYVQNGYLKLKQFPHPIEQYSADILFDKNRLILNSVKGRMAGGNVSASGQISFIGYRNIPIAISGQFIDASFEVPSGFSTRGSGEVSVSGNWLPYTLGVNYNVVSARVDKEFKSEKDDKSRIAPSPFLPETVSKRSSTPVVLDINVQLPERVDTSIVVAQIDIDALVSGQINVQGSPENPKLTGRIGIIKGSKVVFRENTFEILSGYLQYNKNEPANPTLNVTAFSTIQAKIGTTEIRQFDVTIRVTGSAQNPEVNVSSQPSLAEKDLISLLAFGFIPNTNQQGGLEGAQYQLGRALIENWFGVNRTVGKRLGVQFDWSTDYDKESATDTHTFTVKKQWTPKFGASVSQSVGKTNKRNVRAEYKINNNLSVIGSYEGEEQTGSNEVTEEEQDTSQFGIDLEYKVDFK